MAEGREDTAARLALLQERAGQVGTDASWLAIEIALAILALRRADAAEHGNDRLGTLQALRLLSESALRLRWVAGDATDLTLEVEPHVDRGVVVERLASLRKRDLLNLAAAVALMGELAETKDREPSKLRAEADALDIMPAPQHFAQFVTSPTGRRAYTIHRVCSSMTHLSTRMPGLLRMPMPYLPTFIDGCASLIWMLASLALTSLTSEATE